MFEFYVLNYNFNKRKIESWNIFNNWIVDDAVRSEVKRYLRSQNKYYDHYVNDRQQSLFINHDKYADCKTPWDVFKVNVLNIIKWEECSRCEYEIAVGGIFDDDISKFEKWDCYMQCVKNIDIICHEIIRKYKQCMKEEKEGKKENERSEQNL